MNVALPEIDGRIITRARLLQGGVAPRSPDRNRARCLCAVADRIGFVADLARNWVRLRRTPAAERRIALVLANYPERDGRIGNGVGLDTPQPPIEVLQRAGGRRLSRRRDPAGWRCAHRAPCGPARPTRRRPPPRSRRELLPQRLRRLLRDAAARRAGAGRTRAGARPSAIPAFARAGSIAAASPSPRCASAMSRWRSSRRAATTSIPPPAITRPIWRRRMAISPSMPGCADGFAPRRWCIWASTAISNGCRARRWRSRPSAFPRRRWGRCRISIPSSSTIPAKARRPSAAPRR